MYGDQTEFCYVIRDISAEIALNEFLEIVLNTVYFGTSCTFNDWTSGTMRNYGLLYQGTPIHEI